MIVLMYNIFVLYINIIIIIIIIITNSRLDFKHYLFVSFQQLSVCLV